MRKIVGHVTQAEKEEIQNIFNRKRGLEELFNSLVSTKADVKNNPTYDRLLKDYTDTTTQFHDWWSMTSQRYLWEGIDSKSWLIDFNTNEIYLE
jgi:CXXX repeat modification system protein